MEMKITDLHCHCLEEIFKHLNDDEILNVALSDQCFISSCSNVFSKKYKMTKVTFRAHDTKEKIDRKINKLRYFRKSISTLDIDCRTKEYIRIKDSFTKYCKETIGEIIFRNGEPIDIMLSKPFLKLEKLTFSNCNIHFSKNIFNSVNLPHLHSLTFNGKDSESSIIDATFIEQTFLNLKEFGAVNVNINLRSLILFASQNPQLEGLTLVFENITNAFIADIAENLPNLKSLTLDLTVVQHETDLNIKETLLRELKSLQLFVGYDDQLTSLLTSLPISSARMADQIEQLELHFNDSRVEDEFYDFIGSCKNLKQLKVFDCDVFDLTSLTNMQQLKNVKIKSSNANIYDDGMYVFEFFDGVVDIVKTSPHLHQICLEYSFSVKQSQLQDIEEEVEEQVNEVRSKIGSEWEIVGTLNSNVEQVMYGIEADYYMFINKK